MTHQKNSPGSSTLKVIITGATSGVGEATAQLFAAEGASVALLGRRETELVRVLESIGGRSHHFRVDIADSVAAKLAVHDAVQALGGVDVVVNAAGVAESAMLEELHDDLWQRTIDTNLTGTFVVAREAALLMRSNRGGGAIVNVASDLAHMGAAGLTHYSATKAGVVGLTRALAIELAPLIRVNAICPGPIDSPMLRAGIAAADDPQAALKEKVASVPLQRLAEPAEVARAIRFLAVDATFATGSSLEFDGGTSAAY